MSAAVKNEDCLCPKSEMGQSRYFSGMQVAPCRDHCPGEERLFMNYFKKLLSVLAIVGSLAGTLSLIACNTIHGLGEDIERGGQKTQDAADAVKRWF